jgi:hypothetical protein
MPYNSGGGIDFRKYIKNVTLARLNGYTLVANNYIEPITITGEGFLSDLSIAYSGAINTLGLDVVIDGTIKQFYMLSGTNGFTPNQAGFAYLGAAGRYLVRDFPGLLPFKSSLKIRLRNLTASDTTQYGIIKTDVLLK